MQFTKVMPPPVPARSSASSETLGVRTLILLDGFLGLFFFVVRLRLILALALVLVLVLVLAFRFLAM